jgi:hypothetical protein
MEKEASRRQGQCCGSRAWRGSWREDYARKARTTGEYMETLDLFYSEPTNRGIPIVAAMVWCARKSNGASTEDLKRLETELRAKTVAVDDWIPSRAPKLLPLAPTEKQ